jgi:hypothetical protein
MSRLGMRNLEALKIGSSQVNEFEYQKNQGELTEQLEQHPDEAITAKRPTRAEQVKQIMAKAHAKVEKKRKKAVAKTGGKSKKLASKTAGRKTTSKMKATTKKATSRKVSKGSSGKKASRK